MKKKFTFLAFFLPLVLGVLVSCSDDDSNVEDLYLKVSKGSELSFGFNYSDAKYIVIQSNTSWELSKPADASWVTLDMTSGSNDAVIGVTVDENPEGPRSTTLTLSSPGSNLPVVSINITQSQYGDEIISINRDEIILGSTSTYPEYFKITSSVEWNITTSESWLSVSPSNGAGDAEIEVSATTNNSPDSRDAIITISSPDGKFASIELNVLQGENEYFDIFSFMRDMNFRLFCMQYDTNNDNRLSLEEAAAVTFMELPMGKFDDMGILTDGIKSISGIEFFTNLEVLDCSYNPLEGELDFSSQTKLVELYLIKTGKVAGLNVKQCASLKVLNCISNQITSLDVTECYNLEKLVCSENLLTEIDVTKNTKLINLATGQNEELASIDLSKCTELETIALSSTKISSVDISSNTKLTQIIIEETNLSALDVSKHPDLLRLYVSNNALTELNVSNNPKLKVLSCGSNKLTKIDTKNNPLLTDLWLSNNQIKELDLSNNTLVSSFQVSYNLLTKLDMSPCTGMVQCFAANNKELVEIDASTCKKMVSFVAQGCDKLNTIWVWQEFKRPGGWSVPAGVEYKEKPNS